MKKLFLKNGNSIKIDDLDWENLSQFKWGINKKGYAYTNFNRKLITMHRMILNPPKNKCVDHINMDRLDNRRKNLRICSFGENLMNRGPQKNNKAGLKGVYFFKPTKKWAASICKNRKIITIGYYSSPKHAAIAYDAAAKILHGDFAYSNF